MQKISTVQTSVKNVFEGQLSIGLDLRDRSSAYCVLNEAGEIVLEHKLATTPEAMAVAPDGDPCPRGTGERANRSGECRPRIGEVLR